MRALRSALRAQRASTIGPDLSHRRTLVAQLLKTQAVRQALRREMRVRVECGRPLKRRAALLLARKHALEIAAHYSPVFITFMEVVLRRLWNSLYDGVEVGHAENLDRVGDGVPTASTGRRSKSAAASWPSGWPFSMGSIPQSFSTRVCSAASLI